MYFNGFNWNGRIIRLRTFGPSPRFSSFEDFRAEWEKQQGCVESPEEYDLIVPPGKPDATNRQDAQNDGATSEETPNIASSPTNIETSTNAEFSEGPSNENRQLHEEIQRLLRENSDLTAQLKRSESANENLKTSVQSLKAEAEENAKEATVAKNELESANKKAESNVGKLSIAKRELEVAKANLAAAEKQRDAIHESWQEQAAVLMDKEEQVEKLSTKLEEAEKTVKRVTDSLVLQNEELAIERKARKYFENERAVFENLLRSKKDIKPSTKHLKIEASSDFDV